MNKLLGLRLVFLLGSGFMTCAFFRLNSQTPETVFLNPSDNIRQVPSYGRILNSSKNLHDLERSKIDYLIETLQNSPVIFIRNGAPYSGKRAATHLMLKYRQRSSWVKTAEDFINEIGSRSSLTGELYLVKYDDGHTYPMRDVLFNELHRLEHCLAEDRPSHF